MALDKMTPNFLLFGGALVLWASAIGLSGHLAQGGHPGGAVRGNSTEGAQAGMGGGGHSQAMPLSLPPELDAQRKALEEHPEERQRRLEYADGVHQLAVDRKDTQLLMEAVSQYQTLLQRDGKDAEALLGLAHLCFEAGILDKAIDLFPKYLALHPEDQRARVEFALAYLQIGDLEKAQHEVDTVLSANPKLFQAQVTRALVLKLQGKAEESQRAVEAAKAAAPTDDDRKRIDEFLAHMAQQTAGGGEGGEGEGGSAAESAGHAPTGVAASGISPSEISPGAAVVDYFKNHPIIGQKIRGIQWPDANTAVIALENFPVEQMPPFAREKFLANAKQALSVLPSKITVRLVDAETQRELLSIEAGAPKS